MKLSVWSKAPYVFVNGDLPTRVEDALDEQLRYKVPDAEYTDAWRNNEWDGFHRLLRESKNGNLYFPVGCLARVRETLDAFGVDYEVEGLTRPGRGDLDVPWESDIELRDYQRDAVDDCLSYGSGIVVLPTGAGKTIIGLWLIHELKRPTIIFCHRQEIADQWVEQINDTFGREAAVCYGGTRENGDIQVCLYQSVYEDGDVRDDVRLDHDVAIFDECVAGDVSVTMANGSTKPMRDVEVGDVVLSVSDSGTIEPKPVTAKWDKGIKDVVDVAGVICTPDHEFYTVEGKVEASSLHSTNVFALQKRSADDSVQLPKVRIGSGIGGSGRFGAGGSLPVRLYNPPKSSARRGYCGGTSLREVFETVYVKVSALPAQTRSSQRRNGVGMHGKWVPRDVRHGGRVGWACSCRTRVVARDAVHVGEHERVLVGQDSRKTPLNSGRETRWVQPDGNPPAVEGRRSHRDTTKNIGGEAWHSVLGYGVRCVWGRGHSRSWQGTFDSPCQRRRHGQRPFKFGSSLLPMPPTGSQPGRPRFDEHNKGRGSRVAQSCALGVVETGEAEPAGEARVYDIEVAGNHNFFANGMLVSNCHRVAADTFSRVAMEVTAPYRYGLTATPEREDNATLRVIGGAGPIIADLSPETLIERGYLARPEWRILDAPKNMSRYPSWQEEYRGEIVENSERNELIADEIRVLEKPCYVHVERINHGERLESMIDGAEFVHSGTSDRDEKIEAFRNGDIPVLISTLLGEGFDLPAIASLVMAGGLKTSTGAIQKVGRALRPETETATIVDFVDKGRWVSDHSEERIRTYRSYYGEYGP